MATTASTSISAAREPSPPPFKSDDRAFPSRLQMAAAQRRRPVELRRQRAGHEFRRPRVDAGDSDEIARLPRYRCRGPRALACKYPPAEPGALGREPLKAAGRGR